MIIVMVVLFLTSKKHSMILIEKNTLDTIK
jgi:hypothetical protein